VHLVKASHEILDRWNPEAQMNVDVLIWNARCSTDYVQLVMSTYAEPNMLPIFEWLWNPLESENALVESCALLEIADMNRLMIKLGRFPWRARLGKAERTERNYSEPEANADSLHGRTFYRPLAKRQFKSSPQIAQHWMAMGLQNGDANQVVV